MKKLIFSALFALAMQLGFAQENSEKNLIKSFDPQGASAIILDIKTKEINSTVWNGGMMRVELLIKANMPDVVLDQLVKAGRYTVEAVKNEDGTFTVTAPNLSKVVTIKGKDLQEEIFVQVQTPTKYLVAGNKLEKEAPLDVVASRDGNDESAKKAMAKFKAITDKMKTEVKVISNLKKQPKLKLVTGDIKIDGKSLELKK